MGRCVVNRPVIYNMALCQGLHSGKLATSVDRSLALSLSWLDSSSDVDAQSLTVLASMLLEDG